MNKNTITFYLYELDNWNDAIDLHKTEIGKTIDWLREMIHPCLSLELDNIIHDHIKKLDIYLDRKERLVKDIEMLESYLFKNKIVTGNQIITPETKMRQNDIRSKVYNAEKDYLELTYKCNNFLSDHIN